MARVVDTIYDTTSASGGALDTGILNVAQYDGLFAVYKASGGSPTAIAANIVDDAGTALQLASGTPGATTAFAFNWFPAAAGGTAPVNAPVPKRAKFTCTAIAAQTVRLILYGYKLSGN